MFLRVLYKTVQTLRKKACIPPQHGNQALLRASWGVDAQMSQALQQHRGVERAYVNGDSAGTSPLVRSPRSPCTAICVAPKNKTRETCETKSCRAQEGRGDERRLRRRSIILHPSCPVARIVTGVPPCRPPPPLDARSGRESPDSTSRRPKALSHREPRETK